MSDLRSDLRCLDTLLEGQIHDNLAAWRISRLRVVMASEAPLGYNEHFTKGVRETKIRGRSNVEAANENVGYT